MQILHILQSANGLNVGLIGGLAAGLLGVSPGGILVPIIVLLLGVEQQAAQAISLICQVAPTSLAGTMRYGQQGLSADRTSIIQLSAGFVMGALAGAAAAVSVSPHALQWSYVFYLALLESLLVYRLVSGARPNDEAHAAVRPGWLPLVAIGAVAGASSGFMGIGGGLALTVGLTALLKFTQRQAQTFSLALAILPLTLPAAWIYVREGWPIPWLTVVEIVLGLWIGTDLGARMTGRLSEFALRCALAGLILAFAGYMLDKAVT